MAEYTENNNEDLNASQKKGIFKVIQNWFNGLGFSGNEIGSVDDPNILDPYNSKSSSDPFLDGGARTISSVNNSWRTNDNLEGNEETTGFLAKDNRYRDYMQMIHEPELESSLNIYADEATMKNEDGNVLEIISDNSKIKDMLDRLLNQKLNFNREAWDIIFEMLWMGDAYREMYLDKATQKEILKLKRIKPQDVERKEKNNKLEKFLVNGAEVEPFRIIHWRNKTIRFGSYGSSIFESGRTVWKQLKLLEESVLVYRVTRSPERKIFYVDVGQTPPDKADAIIERFKQRFQKKKMIDINSGRIDTVSNVMSYNESYFIPRVSGRDNSEITTLAPGVQPGSGNIEDLAYFKDKLMSLLRIPGAYFHGYSGSESNASGAFTKDKNLSDQDISFARNIGRVHDNFLDGVKKICIVYLALNGISAEEAEQFELKMTKSSAIEEIKRIETQSQIFNLISAIKGLDMFPDVWIMSKFLKLEDEEIAEIIHLMKIQRLQLQPQGVDPMGGGGGGLFPDVGGGGGLFPDVGGGGDFGMDGGIPPEVDSALQGAPGTNPAAEGGAGFPNNQGATQQISAMFNDLEKSAREFEERENSKGNVRDKNAIKRNFLKKRIKRRLSSVRESLDDNFELFEELNALDNNIKEFKKSSIEKAKSLALNLRGILEERKGSKISLEKVPDDYINSIKNDRSDIDIYSYNTYFKLEESINFKPISRGNENSSVLDLMEEYFGTLNEKRQKIKRTPANNYLRELLLEGEIKSLNKENSINVVKILKESMKKYQMSSNARHISGLLSEEMDEYNSMIVEKSRLKNRNKHNRKRKK